MLSELWDLGRNEDFDEHCEGGCFFEGMQLESFQNLVWYCESLSAIRISKHTGDLTLTKILQLDSWQFWGLAIWCSSKEVFFDFRLNDVSIGKLILKEQLVIGNSVHRLQLWLANVLQPPLKRVYAEACLARAVGDWQSMSKIVLLIGYVPWRYAMLTSIMS